jgi:hypothetical protein
MVSLVGFSQKRLITDKEAVIAEGKKELDAVMADPESYLRKEAAKYNLKGEFTFDITLTGRGRVLSVFAVSSDADDIKAQNWLKDKVSSMIFSFKMPRKKTFKFQYIFKF